MALNVALKFSETHLYYVKNTGWCVVLITLSENLKKLTV